MKQLNFRLLAASVVLFLGFQFSSCKSRPKDSDLQSSVNQKLGSPGISATVNDGVVTLDGQCPDEPCRTTAEQSAKDVKGVKSVVNNITVAPPAAAPVEVAADSALESGVRDATKDYPGVTAVVTNGEVTLNGTIERRKLPALMQSINSLKPKKVNNNLTVK